MSMPPSSGWASHRPWRVSGRAVAKSGAVMTRLQAPMDLGDIVSAAWVLCLRRWRLLLPMALVSVAGTLLLNLGLQPLMERAPGATPASLPAPRLPLSLAPLFVPGLLLVLLNQLALIRVSLEVWITGDAAPGRCYLLAARALLSVLAILLLSAALFAVCSLSQVLYPFAGVAIYFAVSWFFAGQVCLAEGIVAPRQVMRRSRALVRGSWWRTAAILLGILLLSILPSIAAGLLPVRSAAGALTVSAAATAIAVPFVAAAQTMLYLDLRLRKHESLTLTPSRLAKPL